MTNVRDVFCFINSAYLSEHLYDRYNISINPFSAGIDFCRQNLTSVDVRFGRLKSIPAL